MEQQTTTARPLHEIAREIERDWKNVKYSARPYLDAMKSLDTMKDAFINDDADTIVRYFLSNATGWRGDNARRIKDELKGMLNGR